MNTRRPALAAGHPRPFAASVLDAPQPNVARVYDALLGGSSNFKADRDLAATLLGADPRTGLYARETVAFRDRAVRSLAQRGIRQYLDIGCGLPTIGAVHHVAHRIVPDARVVYVDVDPVVVAYMHQYTAGDIRLAAIEGDVREPLRVLADATATGLITPTEPVAVLMVAVLQFVVDLDDPAGILAAMQGTVPLGSCLALSHAVRPPAADAETHAAQWVDAQTTNGFTVRTPWQVNGWLHGWTLLEPGVSTVSAWRREPVDEPAPDVPALAAVGVKDLPRTRRARSAPRRPPSGWRTH